ncbi:MAG: hypothetical protein ACE5LU_15795 [Anaerolineae bacterium]
MSESHELSFARLVDWIEGRLSDAEAKVVAEQVTKADAATRADVAWLRAFMRVRESVPIALPPPEVQEWLIRRFEAYAQDQQQPHRLKRLVATLTFDSSVQPGTVGVRAVDTQASQRQLIYSTGIADVVLNIRARVQDKYLDVSGQIFPIADVAPDVFSAQLLRGTEELGITMVDDLGEFTFEAIQPGRYEMVLSTEKYEVSITPIELR